MTKPVIDDLTAEVAETMVVLASSEAEVADTRPASEREFASATLESFGMSVEMAAEMAIFGFVDVLRKATSHLSEFDARRNFVLSEFDELAQVDAHQLESKHPLDRFSTTAFYRGQAIMMAAALVDVIGVIDDAPERAVGMSSHARVILKELRKLFKEIDHGLAGITVTNKVSLDDDSAVNEAVLDGFMRQLGRAVSIGVKRRTEWSKKQVRSNNPRAYNLMVAAALQRRDKLSKAKAMQEAGEIDGTDAQNIQAGLAGVLEEVAEA